MRKQLTFKNLLFIVLMLSLSLIIAGCKTPKEYNVEYINSHLNATGYVGYEYIKTIHSNDFLLLEEKTTAEKQEESYLITKIVKELADITSSETYKTTETTETVELANNPILFELTEDNFETVEVKENSLVGTVKDDADVLGYEVLNLQIKIDLNKDLNVSNVELSYDDPKTGFTVKLVVKYNY